jgi:hypothetical protein
MEPNDDPQLRNVLREWQVEDAPRSLDERVERVLGPRRSWWRMLVGGSVRVPVPVLVGFAAIFVAMFAALMRPAPVPATPVASSVNLADFRPVQNAEVRIIRGSHVDQ